LHVIDPVLLARRASTFAKRRAKQAFGHGIALGCVRETLMLMVVENHNPTRVHRLRIAEAHLESAIAHINNHAQGRMAIREDAMSDVGTLSCRH
jgi:hypothetical protein